MSAYSVATFKVRFSFFSTAEDPFVQACLDEAETDYAYTKSFPQYRSIIGNHAAHLLANNPGGTSMRISKTSPDTPYSVERDRLLKMIPAGPMVIC